MVEHRIQINALALFDFPLRNRLPIQIEMSAGVEMDLQFIFCAEGAERHAVHHFVIVQNNSAHQGHGMVLQRGKIE